MKKIIIAFIFLTSCASIQSLDGGDKDTTPPKITSVSPENESLFVKDASVVFNFDEYIKAPKLNDVLIISPSQKIKPNITVKNKRLSIKLKDSLLENTTYLIQLNGGVVDNNESNPVDFFNYVFSTGLYIDSLKYEGYVYSYLEKTPLENYNIQLYNTIKDSVIFNEKPDYVVRSNEAGFFSFSNLPESQLMVAVFEDLNKNLLYDKDEKIALLKTISTLNNTIDTFYTFENKNTDKNKIDLVKKNNPGVLKFKSNRRITDKITAQVNNTETDYYLNRNKDTITLYYEKFNDSLSVNLLVDTFNFDFEITTYRAKKLALTIDKAKSGKKELFITSSQPITFIGDYIDIVNKNQTSSYIKKQINPVTYFIGFDNIIDTVNLIFKPEAIITSHDNLDKADTLLYVVDNKYSNQLKIKVNANDSVNYIAELIQNNNVIQYKYFTKTEKIIFENINPGTYSLRIIYDLNNNQIWDTGDIFNYKKPEYIKLFNAIEIRNNWDKELIINLLQTN